MPTNEERKALAKRLRTLASHGAADEEMVLDALDLYPGEYIEGFNPRCVERLADLIEPEPERTCRIRQHRCTNCDHEINNKAYFVKIELGDGIWTVGSRTANYCPNCGCRIKEEPYA